MAVIRTVPGYTDANFFDYIPQIHSVTYNAKFYVTSTMADITNTNWEGDIKDKGNIVYISNIPDINAVEEIEGEIIDYDEPEVTRTSLEINRSVRYAFNLRSLLQTQTHHKDLMSRLVDDGTKKSAIKIDNIVLNEAVTLAHADNKGTTAGVSGAYNMGQTGDPVIATPANFIETLVYAGAVLDEQNVPRDGMRYCVLPVLGASLLKLTDLKDVSFSGGSKSWLLDRNGRLGETFDGMQVYISNNLSAVTDSGRTCYNALIGHKSAITFAAQLTEHDNDIKDRKYWGRFVRDRVVFGYQVVKPEGIVALYFGK